MIRAMHRRTYLDRFFLLPTYCMYRLVRPYMYDAHPWKSPIISWRLWLDSSTDLNIAFGGVFWFLGLFLMLLLYRIFVSF